MSNIGNSSTSNTVAVAETVPAGMTLISMSGSGWTCSGSGCTRSDSLAANASYPVIAVTVNVSATAAGNLTNAAAVSGGGETNTANDQATDPTAIQSSALSISIWSNSAVPGTPFTNSPPLTLGVRFRSDAGGSITGIRYYKGVGNIGTHIGVLYSNSGVLLAQATFQGETASGWQTVAFTTPVAISANTTYIAAYFSPSGYGYDLGYFSNSGMDNGPLHALRSGVDGPNGLYAFGGAPTFPASSVSNANFWADVVFSQAISSPAPDLTIGIGHTGNFTQGQAGAAYAITASNIGNASTSSTVAVTETVPAGMTLISMSGSGWTCSGSGCTRSDSLAANASYPVIVVTVNVSATAAGNLTNTAAVSGGGETNTANDQAADPTTIQSSAPSPAPDLTIGIGHTGNFTPGQTGATYTITVSNIGNSPTSSTVAVTETVPAGMTLISMSGSGWTCSGSGCTRSDSLPANASYPVIAVTVNVSATAAGNLTNTAAVSGGGETNTANDQATDPTTIQSSAPSPAPDLTIGIGHTGNFTPGQTGATYTITVSNIGNSPTSSTVAVTETVPAGMTLISMSGSGWTCSGSGCTRSDSLAANASYPVIAVTVNVSATAAGNLTNTAAVSGGGETNTANDQATDPTAIQSSAPSISIWSNSAVPGTPFTDSPPLTLGVRFRSDAGGSITGIRYYKGVGNIGTHIGVLYSNSGVLLAQATFQGETASGWQTVAFTTPVAISANTTYIAAYFSPSGYGYDLGYFSNSGMDNGPLHALRSGVDGPNGLYAFGGAPTFPASSVSNANFWADVVFSQAISSPAPDLTIGIGHTGNFTQGQAGATYAITASNIGNASTSSTVAVTETVPAGMTLISMSGSGWTCSGSGCTRSDSLAANASYPVIVVTVNVSATAAGNLTNTAAVSGGERRIRPTIRPPIRPPSRAPPRRPLQT